MNTGSCFLGTPHRVVPWRAVGALLLAALALGCSAPEGKVTVGATPTLARSVVVDVPVLTAPGTLATGTTTLARRVPTAHPTPSPAPSAGLSVPSDSSQGTLEVPTPRSVGNVIVLAPIVPCGAVSISDVQHRAECDPPQLQSGSRDGREFMAAVTFDLSPLPAGAEVLYAGLELTGLEGDFLAEQGSWFVRMIKIPANRSLAELSFARLLAAPNALPNLVWRLRSDQLSPGGRNTLQFEGEALVVLSKRLGNGTVTFRMDGPSDGTQVFRWAARGEDAPRLRIAYVLTDHAAEVTEVPLILWDDEGG